MDVFVEDFQLHNGSPDNIKVVTCDMSLGCKKGIMENFPNATMVIDKFHVIKHANEAVDKVRKEEVKTNPLLKNTKYLWLKNEKNLSENQHQKMETLSKKRLKTSRAYSMQPTSGNTTEDIISTLKNCRILLQSLRKSLSL